MTDSHDLSALLDRSEGETLDFKAKCYDLEDSQHKRKFAKDLASLANTPRNCAAHIVLGVKKFPNGKTDLWGVDKDIDDDTMQSVAFSFLDPSPRFNYQVLSYCGILLGLVTIHLGLKLPSVPRKSLGCGFLEGRIYFRRGSQNALASPQEQQRIWDWLNPRDVQSAYRDPISKVAATPRNGLHAEALLLGPVEALGLTIRVKEAERLASEAPVESAELYREIAQELSYQFPIHADRFERLRAMVLRAAGDYDLSHDLLMKLATSELCERKEPRLSPNLSGDLNELRTEVDEVRQVRATALIHFGSCHEYPGELEKLAECFDSLGAIDEYSPIVAMLLAEAVVANRDFKLVLDREDSLLEAVAASDTQTVLRVRAAIGDAGVTDIALALLSEAESLRFQPAEGTYVCLRGARWCAWNGQLDRAKSLCRLAMKLGSEAGLDLDIENALWVLTYLHTLSEPSQELFEELIEANRMALFIEGTRSYVTPNSRTRLRSYQHLADDQLPDAHLWTRFRLLESIRSGCLADELESHKTLARIYVKSDEHLSALEHAILGGEQKLVKELTPEVGEWPNYLADMVLSKAPWVRRAALLALGIVGDFAPTEVARELFSKLLCQIEKDPTSVQTEPILLEALGGILLEATDENLDRLIPHLERHSIREPGAYRLTDPGTLNLAARLYKFTQLVD